MSTAFRLEVRVLMRELFDGRLHKYNVVEEIVPNETSESHRVLVDDRGNDLWVDADDDGSVACLTRYGFQSPVRILKAIIAAFDTEIYSEHEPQFWGYRTDEEWEAAMGEMAREDTDNFYADIVKFVTGKEHGLTPGTIGMMQGEIAKALVAGNPDLILPQNKAEFLRAIDEEYERREHPVRIKLDEKDWAAARMIWEDVDELPRA